MNNAEKIKIANCPVCGNKDADKHIFIETVETISRIGCTECNCIYFEETPKNLPKYDLEYNKHFFRPGDISKAGIMAAKIGDLAKKNFRDPCILEVGTGNGLTVFLLKTMGLRAEGLDIDPELAGWLEKRFNIKVHAYEYEVFFPLRYYNLIYSSHTIEHCKDPVAFFAKTREILAQDGLFYLDTPDTFFYGKSKDRWHHFETRAPFEHICLLSVESIYYLAQQTGFKVEWIKRMEEYQSLQAILKPIYS